MRVNNKIRYQRKLLCTAISLSLLPFAGIAVAQDSEPATVEEVIVTGSFIRRTEGFRSASPLTQLSLEDIAAEGTPNIGDVIHNLSFNQGSSISSNITPGSGSTETAINLRGLGAGATLNLMDGKRIIDDNTNVILPQIAIQRLDIVVDGAAALYGSAAVAGVVNFVPIKSYDGFKIELFNQGDSRGDFQEFMVNTLWGADIGGLDLVVAGQWRDNENLRWLDRPRQFYAGFNSSSSGNPGNFNVPSRDENGVLTGVSARRPDAGCGALADREDPTIVGGNPNGTQFAGQCYMDFGQWWEYNPKVQQGVFYANAAYEASEDLSFNAQVTWNSRTYLGQNSASDPGGRVAELPIIRGELPGNPYRARDASGNPLFAMDANGDTLPDRGANGAVLLAPIPTDPTSGIPFNEDVTFSGWRPFGRAQTIPSRLNSNGSFPGSARERSFRVAFDATFSVPYIDGWEGVASVMYSDEYNTSRYNNQSFSAIKQGLECDTLTDRKSCFNPFAPNPNALDGIVMTPQHVADSIFPTEKLRDSLTSDLYTVDLVFNGTVSPGGFELPGGPIGLAFGAQRRGDGFEYIPPTLYQSGDLYNGQPDERASTSRDVDAWFIEVAIPVLPNLELSAASRDETYSTGQSSSDPKFGITYSPTEWLTLRGTKGTAFIAPGLNALSAPERCGLSNIDDPFTTFFAFARTCQSGNPLLQPESANTLSAGFTVEPVENLRIDLDWSKTDFSDRIVSVDPQQVLANDFFAFRQATGFSGGLPSLAQLAAWTASGADRRIQRNPADLAQILRVTVGQSNASNMLVKAFDLKVNYRFDLGDVIGSLVGTDNLGSLAFNLQATKIDEFTYQKFPTDPVTDVLGKQNRFVGEAPPLPEWKGNVRVSWVNGNHSAFIMAHYIDEVAYDGTQLTFSFPFLQPLQRDTLRASTVTDVAYNYTGLSLWGTDINLTIGSRNVFDRLPQRVNDFAGMESILYDARGRLVYGRITMEL